LQRTLTRTKTRRRRRRRRRRTKPTLPERMQKEKQCPPSSSCWRWRL
jgi:hypothetical protein